MVVVGILVLVGAVVLLGNQGQKTSQTSIPTPTQVSGLGQQVSSASIELTSSGFIQQTLNIKVGTKVTWMNKSGVAIQIASAPHPTHTAYPPLNLGMVEDGGSVSLIFGELGTYEYHNHLNPTQSGSIVVE